MVVIKAELVDIQENQYVIRTKDSQYMVPIDITTMEEGKILQIDDDEFLEISIGQAAHLLKNIAETTEDPLSLPDDNDDASLDAIEMLDKFNDSNHVKWHDKAIQELLNIFKVQYKKFRERKIKTMKQLWMNVETEMKAKGFAMTNAQCENKWKSLKRAYKGGRFKRGRFENDVKEILREEMEFEKYNESFNHEDSLDHLDTNQLSSSLKRKAKDDVEEGFTTHLKQIKKDIDEDENEFEHTEPEFIKICFADKKSPNDNEQSLQTKDVKETNWDDDAIIMLIKLYEAKSKLVENGLIKTMNRMWTLISMILCKNGHNYTAAQCENKWKGLKRRYFQCLGTGRSFPYERALQKIFKDKEAEKVCPVSPMPPTFESATTANGSNSCDSISQSESSSLKGEMQKLAQTFQAFTKSRSDMDNKRYAQNERFIGQLTRMNILLERLVNKS